jgi:prepilin-type N-terminal cleavage/methylation domain-containing protein
MWGHISFVKQRVGFTIVELIVVIAVIGILAGIGVVSYGAWRTSINQNQVKSELAAAASAMESSRNFDAGYPGSVPPTYAGNDDVTVSGGSSDAGKSYCLDGVSVANNAIQFYIDNTIQQSGAAAGTCATRTLQNAPTIPSNIVLGSPTASSVALTWTGATGATGYVTQCASDPAFIYGLKETSVGTSTNATITGLTPSSSFYCRVKASNNAGVSAWSATSNSTTSNQLGSLPVGTSIEGYWSVAPQGYLLEDGAAVSRAVYSELFSAIGTNFGTGDGSTTFNVPDSRGRVSVAINSADATFDVVGEKTGSKTERLTAAQLPSHQHAIRAEWGTNANLNFGVPGQYNQLTTNTAFAFRYEYTRVDGGGGGEAHTNIQPSIVKRFAIKYAAVDPTAAEVPAGTSIAGYWATVPTGYQAETGGTASRTSNADLFSAIGTTFGVGNGSTTFTVPNASGRASVGLTSLDTSFDVVGETGGAKTVTLTAAQIPPHSHAAQLEYGTNANLNISPPGQYAQLTNNGNYAFQTAFTRADGGSDQPHNEIQPSIVRRHVIKLANGSGTGNAVPVGTTISGYWTSATPPVGYLAEDGAAVSRTTYAALFGVIGTTHGAGNGSTTFNVPDSRGRVSVNLSPYDSEFNAIGKLTGVKDVTLTLAQIPNHQHAIRAEWGTNNTLNYGVPSQYNMLTTNPAHGFHTHAMRADGGSGQSHSNLQPYIVERSFIKF